MDFSFDHIGFANLFGNGNNYVAFSIMGMLIVFAGLSFITIYITLLPKILNLPNLINADRKEKKEQAGAELTEAKDYELLLAITVALHLDQAGSSNEKITWKRSPAIDSAWLTAGRMRGIALRTQLPDRRI
ncbi:MAG: OadG family protein [Desulfobulbales bacterium]|nr:OadG family protein [Desulfobulbales bacterium]